MRVLWLLWVLTGAAEWAKAHNVYIEPEFVERASGPEGDWSFVAPYVLGSGTPPYSPANANETVESSQLLYGYLSGGRDEADVVHFSVKDQPLRVRASTLVPACQETEGFYPSTALVGPGLQPFTASDRERAAWISEMMTEEAIP
ncbi:unnamed protein product [Chrysoparadoxa australica]